MNPFTKKELARAALDAPTLFTSVQAKVARAEAAIAAAADPYGDPERNRRAQQAVRKAESDKLWVTLTELRAAWDQARETARFHTRGAYLRAAGLEAGPGAVALLSAASDAALVRLVQEASARGDAATVGVAFTLGRSLRDATLSRQLGAVFTSVRLPDQEEAESRLRAIRDSYLQAEALVRGVASPEAGTTASLSAARQMAEPVAVE